MKILEVTSLAIPDILRIRFARFNDHRGYFAEPWRLSDLAQHTAAATLRDVRFVQLNENFSRAGAVRGLHFQWNPCMGKLVRTVSGHMLDMALDIRRGSPYYGKIVALDMPSNPEQDYGEWIWVPPGFAHGNVYFQPTQMEYLCSSEYNPRCEAGISPLAADLDWSLCTADLKAAFDEVVSRKLIISEKDASAPTLQQWADDPRSGNFVYNAC